MNRVFVKVVVAFVKHKKSYNGIEMELSIRNFPKINDKC